MKNKEKKPTKTGGFFKENAYIFAAFIASAVLMMIVYFCNDVIPFGDHTVLRMDLFHFLP